VVRTKVFSVSRRTSLPFPSQTHDGHAMFDDDRDVTVVRDAVSRDFPLQIHMSCQRRVIYTFERLKCVGV
jgi:hypothetical protein